MIPILAHGFGAGSNLPLPRWLLAYLLAFAVLLVALAIRVTAPHALWKADGERPSERRDDRPPIASFVGLAIYVVLVVLASASATGEVGFVSVTVISVLWLAGIVLAALTGGWVAAFSPFDAIGWLIDRRDRDVDHDRPQPPTWTAALGLFAFLWFWLVYGLRAPNDREIAVFRCVYVIAVTAGVSVWGRAWVQRGEAFTAVFRMLGAASVLSIDPDTRRPRLRAPLRGIAERGAVLGTTALVAVLLGGVAFDGLSQTSWWLQVLGSKTGWSLNLVNTIGFVWVTVVIAAAIIGAARLAAKLADRDGPDLSERFAVAVVPLAVGCWLAHELTTFLIDGQNFIALTSDPTGRGWDLFGTIDNPTNYSVLTPVQTTTVGAIAILLGGAGAAVLAHEAAFGSLPARAALRAEWPLVVTLMIGVIAATALLLGT
ncbi:MAG: hypothetical protein QOH64_3560 [Acidimicrobiaceae bacterium]